MKINDKVKVNKDIPSINGMLYKDSTVKIDQITEGKTLMHGSIRVIDSLGKIWWVNEEDINV